MLAHGQLFGLILLGLVEIPCLEAQSKFVMPVKTGIQVTDSVRHTVEKLVPYSDTGRYPGDYREIAFGTEFNVAKVNGAKL